MIAVVSHDAGGAEILSSWLNQNKQPNCLVLDGPAIAIFHRKLGKCENYSIAQAIELCDLFLCGTSWQSSIEKQAMALAKAAGKKVIAFLDHWANYADRFQLDGVTILPDEIWVGDEDAEHLAKKIFPDVDVVLLANPYFKDLQVELARTQRRIYPSNGVSVLYICEPIREHAFLAYGNERHWGYTEEDALLFFFDNLDALDCVVSEIKIRPHPSESNDKYNWAWQANSLVNEATNVKSLVEQIVEADVVVGCTSMAMVVALLASKRVISCIPPGGKACNLPQVGIEHLQALVVKNKGVLGG